MVIERSNVVLYRRILLHHGSKMSHLTLSLHCACDWGGRRAEMFHKVHPNHFRALNHLHVAVAFHCPLTYCPSTLYYNRRHIGSRYASGLALRFCLRFKINIRNGTESLHLSCSLPTEISVSPTFCVSCPWVPHPLYQPVPAPPHLFPTWHRVSPILFPNLA